MDKKTIKPEEPTIGTQTLSQYVTLTIEQESQTLRELIDLVTDSITIKLNGGQICSDSKLSSTELELLAMKIPSECLRIQTALNRYTGENVFRDIAIEARVTQSITDMIGQKGCADERKRKAELLVLDERATSAANKARGDFIVVDLLAAAVTVKGRHLGLLHLKPLPFPVYQLIIGLRFDAGESGVFDGD